MKGNGVVESKTHIRMTSENKGERGVGGYEAGALWRPRGVGWGGRWEEVSRRGHVYIYG